MNKLNSKDFRAQLKAEVKATQAEGIQLRLTRQAAGAAGNSEKANATRLDQVDYYRPRARALYLAYAFIKGRTYEQVEAHCDEDNEPYGYLGHLDNWDGDADLACDWIRARDKTRFDLTPEPSQEAVQEPVKAFTPAPKPLGVFGRLRAAMGA